MLLTAYSTSFAYDNGIGVLASPGGSDDSAVAVINNYCEIRFYYVIHRADPTSGYTGSVFLRQGGTYIAGTSVRGNDSNYHTSTELMTAYWYTLTLTATSNNSYAHGLLNW